MVGEALVLERLGPVEGPGGFGSHDDGATVRRGDGEVGGRGVWAGRGGPECAAQGPADDGGDVAGVRERIVVPFVRWDLRVVPVTCSPYFRLDEFGQVSAGGLAAAH